MKISVLAAAAALTALLLAGCGGDNSSVATATTSAGGSTATTSNSASSATTSSSDSSGTTAEPAADTTAPSFQGNSDNAFCQTARDLQASDIGSTLSGEGNVKAGLEKIQAAINDLKNKAPNEIKADVNTLATGIQKLNDFYAKYDYDPTKLAAAAQKDPTILQSLSDFNNAEFTAATDRITAYGEQVCGISDTTETT
jgi:hypothetical protein